MRARLCLNRLRRRRHRHVHRKESKKKKANLELLVARQLVVQAQLGEVSNLDSLRAQEDAAFGSAGEVPGAVDAAVVLTCGLVEGHADPGADAWDVWDLADEGDDAAAVVV